MKKDRFVPKTTQNNKNGMFNNCLGDVLPT
jgi:hypothetical protein